MNAPLTAPAAPEDEQVVQAVDSVRAKWAARQSAAGARQAAKAENEKLRQAHRASRIAARRSARLARADGAMDAAGAAGGWLRQAAPVVGAAVPVALVNATAFVGQFAWVQAHVPWKLPLQVMFALALEAVAIYLAWHAHQAQLADDSSGRLKLGAYLFALVIGAMNYSHYAPHWRPDALAVALGLMSALSPWLWGIHSRRASRDRLKAQGLIEGHAVRLGANRWLWHPWRSVQVMYRATWVGENSPRAAIADWEAHAQWRMEQRRADWRAGRDRRAAKIAAAELARQAAPEIAVPVAQEAAPAGGAPALPAGAVAQEQPLDRATLENLADAGALQLAGYTPSPAGPTAVIPGTQLNGHPVKVRAIAPMKARPVMGATHPIDQALIQAAELYLAGLSAAEPLPSERFLAKMLCDQNHDHRRQAKPLLEAARDARDAAAQVPPRPRPVTQIASPASTLPGGVPANG